MDGHQDHATRVVLSVPADLSPWGREQLETPWVRAYLTRTMGAVEPGDVVEVFLDVGCCGDTLDVPLWVERVEGAGPVEEGTTISYEAGAARGVAGGWLVQSRAGPGGSAGTGEPDGGD